MADTTAEIVTIPKDKQQADEDRAKLQLLHSHGYLCDVVLSVGGREFPAHRILLAKASDYFERMFDVGLKETNQKHVEIQGVDADILQALVGHCYCHPISVPASKLLDLLSAADMLQFPGVKNISLSLIKDRVTIDNVIDIYESAKLLCEEELKTTAEAYIRNHFRVVSKKERFLDLEYDDLEAILSCEKLGIITEMDVFHSIETWCRHKQETREKHFPTLLKHVRLHHLPADVVVSDVASSPLVASNLECMKVVVEFGFKQLPAVKKRSLHAGKDIFVIGGDVSRTLAPSATNLVQKYSASTKRWSCCHPMKEARSKAVAAGYMDNIYVYGGTNPQYGQSLSSMEMFCQQKEIWRSVNAPKVARYKCGFCECDGSLYAIGGENNRQNLKSAERYDPVRDQWHAIASMPSALDYAVAVNHKDSVYIFGFDNDNLAAFTYDPRIDKVECCNHKMDYNSYPQAAVSIHQEEIDVIQDNCRTVDIFEPRQNIWRQCKTNFDERMCFAAVGYQDSVLVIGGEGVFMDEITDISAFDNKSKFTTFMQLPTAVSGCCAVVV